jgi:DNA-binding response OmpR family regulator
LRAVQTAGGHYRVDLRDLEKFIFPARRHQERSKNVLVVTGDSELKRRLFEEAENVPFNVRITDCGYDCSLLVDSFRPDFVVLDCSVGLELTKEFICHLTQDPRIPDIRILLAAGENDAPPKHYGRMVHAWVKRPFSIWDIVERIHLLGD